jgi:hypothetical protein
MVLVVLAVAGTAAPARAQWVVTPYVAINVAGGAVQAGKGGVGGSVGYFGGRLGLEFDIARHHHFFRDEGVSDLVPDPRIDLDTDAWVFMGNLVAPVPIQGAPQWLPYGTAGLGVIHAWFDGTGDLYDTDQDDLAFNVGGGVMYSLNDRVRLRGDLRYFRALVDENVREGGYFKDYDFWRATLGVTLAFPKK